MKNTRRNELAVCGFEAVKALCRKNPEKIKRMYFNKDRMKYFGEVCKELAKRKAPYNVVEDEDLEKLSETVHHQGVVALIEMPEIIPLSSSIVNDWLHGKEDAVLLDRIGNANNFGAIVRSAAFFGLKNIVIPLSDEQTTITTSSYRIAQGGMEEVKIFSVRNTEKFLESLEGKMVRIGTDLKAKKDVRQMSDIKGKKSALVVLGNEEKGISDDVRKLCDELIIINGAKDKSGKNNVESLNVAQASSIIFYELMR